MSTAVITSIYGGYDQIREQPEQNVDAEWICVADKDFNSMTWDIVVEPRPTVSDRLAAKIAKCCPWYYTSADVVVWIDGPYVFKDEDGLRKLLSWSNEHAISQFVHYSRNCIYEEAEFSKDLPKYSFQPIMQQVEQYRKLDFPADIGLYGGGVIVRDFRRGRLQLRDFGREWLMEQIRWTDQDQISEMFVLWAKDMAVNTLPGNLLDNDALIWTGHAKGENR